jgi:hypothetical protein
LAGEKEATVETGGGGGSGAAAVEGADLGAKKRERTCCFGLPMASPAFRWRAREMGRGRQRGRDERVFQGFGASSATAVILGF